MTTNLEQIDLLRERANVSYEEAKEALEKNNNDMVEALVYLERNQKVKENMQKKGECGHGFIKTIKNLIRKGNVTKLVIKKSENNILMLPVNVGIIITLIAPYVTAAGLILALFTGHKIQFIKEDGSDLEVNKMLDKVSAAVDEVKNNVTAK